MDLDYLYRNVELPPLAKVRRRFQTDSISDLAGTIVETMEQSGISERLEEGSTVAVGVGSRGVHHLPEIVRAVIDWFKASKTLPFIFPAMGSHGGGTSEGQIELLKTLGVTNESSGCPILSDIDAVEIGHYQTGFGNELKVYFDSHAHGADAVFFLSRIKPHPGFTAKHESGFCKMLAIGCGKHLAAETCHRLGYQYFPEVMVGMAKVALENMPQIIGALAIVENAVHETALVECVPREKLFERDAKILDYARTCIPDLPLKQMHALVLDYMGKNIAGPGMDPNITGRFLTDRIGDVKINGVAVLNLTVESHGNANGMGAADFITQRLHDEIDFKVTYLNGLSDPSSVKDISLPPVMPNDQGAMCMALKKGNPLDAPPLLVRIQDTLSLEKLLVSPAVLKEIRELKEYELIEEPSSVKFDVAGNLCDRYKVWDAF